MKLVDPTLPVITDNAKGVAADVLCQCYVATSDGRKFKLGEPAPRVVMETTNKLFYALQRLTHVLSQDGSKIKAVYVEPVDSGKSI